MKVLMSLLASVFLVGCSTHSSNMQVGNTQSYLSLKGQREAIRTVQHFETLPNDATLLGEVEAARCHRDTTETKPTDESVINDLKVAAYAQGADGITDVSITQKSGLMKNCWYILDGKASMFMIKP